MYHSKPLSQAVSPVSATELNDWVRGLDECDPMLKVVLKAATGFVIDWLELELLSRDRLATWKDWPVIGTPTAGISHTNATYKTTLEIPYANLITMDAVLIDGALVTDYHLFTDQRPALIDLRDVFSVSDYDEPAIQIQYQAGFGGADDVPDDIKIGIMMLAGYMYDKRGACDLGEALSNSGAKSLLQPHKVNVAGF